MRLQFFLITFLSSIFLFSSCKEDKCTSLPDMEGLIMNDSNEALAGNDFDFDHVVSNLEDVNCEETEIAGASITGLVVDYTPDENSPFEVQLDEDYPLDAIPSGENIIQDFEVRFETAGIYILKTFADDTEVVEERNENNNADGIEAEGRSSKKNIFSADKLRSSLVVYVKPNPNHIPAKNGPKVTVKRVGVTKSF